MTLPVSGEYMHGRAYDVSKRYGKDTLVLIDKLGTGRLTSIFALKGWVDAQLSKLPLRPKNLTDRVMQGLSRIWPTVLPGRTETLRDRYAHHLILKMRDDGVAEAYLDTHLTGPESGWFARTPREGKIAGLHRFAAAGRSYGIKPCTTVSWRHGRARHRSAPQRSGLVRGFPAGSIRRAGAQALLRPLLLPRFALGLSRQAWARSCKDQKAAARIARHARGKVSRRAQCRACLQSVRGVSGVLPSLHPTNTLIPGIGKMSTQKDYDKGLLRVLGRSAGAGVTGGKPSLPEHFAPISRRNRRA